MSVVRGKDYELAYLSSTRAEPLEIAEVFFQGLSKYRQLKGMRSYPARTMQMVRNHGVVETIRRTGTQGDTKTMHFMASNKHLHYTSEWLVSHTFAGFFTESDIRKALMRLKDACLV